VRPVGTANHSSPSSAAVMEQYSYTSTHPLGHIGPVTGSLYLYIYFFNTIAYDVINFWGGQRICLPFQ